jgi:phospholipid/cholesterol/gamma-HCH transport system ATP-binding protein
MTTTVQEQPKTASAAATLPIEVRDLRKSFGEQKVLDGVSLETRRGETLAVLGRSGTGKSVLLKILIGLQKPDRGVVRIAGRDVASLRPKDLNEVRKRMGFLFQQAALYDSLTVEENVAFPLRRHARLTARETGDRAKELLASVGMDADLDKLPSEISGGMQKRVGLARALALDPEILLFDEPTAGLDPITAGEIGRLIVDLKRQRNLTAIVVTHDLRGARLFADRLLLLHEGKVLAEGSYDELVRSKEPFVKDFLKDGG